MVRNTQGGAVALQGHRIGFDPSRHNRAQQAVILGALMRIVGAPPRNTICAALFAGPAANPAAPPVKRSCSVLCGVDASHSAAMAVLVLMS